VKPRFCWWWLPALLGIAACGRQTVPSAPVPALPHEQLAATLYLIGDAGAPSPEGEPVLQALSRDLRAAGGERVVVFLGDNIYPRGMPDQQDPGRKEAERRLAAQIRVVTDAPAKGYFVPGNHDWNSGGWEAARRQERYVDSLGIGQVALKPGGGCPGPSVVDLGRRLRLILLNTEWWLHGAKPSETIADCPTRVEPEMVDSLRSALRTAGDRLVVVAAHHPLTTGGVHGGYFGWRDHLFPLQVVAPGLWLPLPIIGSLYPAARQHGISSQDIPSPAYQRLIAALRRAFADRPPGLYAAGHEHNLQVIAGGPARLELVSGAGIYGHSGRAVPVRGTLFARNASGFARLEVPWTGPARLAVLEVDAGGRSHEAFSTWVE
jgi:Calcineurin-like phosphoesterase